MTGPIAIVAAGELFGGAETHILGLGAFLRDQALEPRIILFHDRELAARCRDAALPVEIVATRSARDPQGPRRLGAMLASHGASVVHVHGYKAAVNAALAPGNFGLVSTLHGQGEPSWRTPGVFLKDRVYRGLEAWSCRRRRAEVCFVTRDLERRHGRRYGDLGRHVIYNGIEPCSPAAHPHRPDGLDPSRLHAIMVGRLTPIKAIDVAVDALAQLAPTSAWHLDVVGDGPLRADLEAQARRRGVGDRVTFHGFRRDVAALMTHSDALVMPSRHEGLPYTLLEAMSLGLPTVASDVGGLAEVLRHEQTGLLVPVGDVGGLAAALSRLETDQELRRRLGAAAAVEQRRGYTLAAMGAGYLEVYRVAGRR